MIYLSKACVSIQKIVVGLTHQKYFKKQEIIKEILLTQHFMIVIKSYTIIKIMIIITTMKIMPKRKIMKNI